MLRHQRIWIKKISSVVDNLSENEKRRLEMLTKIKEMISADYSYAYIAEYLGISERTVIRYKDCVPSERCCMKRPSRKRDVYKYKDEIIGLLREGYHASGIANKMKEKGCKLGLSTLRKYVAQLAKECEIEISKNRKGPNEHMKEIAKEISMKTVIIRKPDIIKHLWMHQQIDSLNYNRLYQQYPVIRKLKACIDDFREIFIRRSMPLLYLFIEHYKNSDFISIASFAKGLERDIEAVENAVASPLSNGFVEGINNRTKVIKRVMYGRCGLDLLSAKIMLPYT